MLSAALTPRGKSTPAGRGGSRIPGGPPMGGGERPPRLCRGPGSSVDPSTRNARPLTCTSLRLRTADKAVLSSDRQLPKSTWKRTVILHKSVSLGSPCLRIEFDSDLSALFTFSTYSTPATGPTSEKIPASCSSETSLKSVDIPHPTY
jgi:hypothetical protein